MYDIDMCYSVSQMYTQKRYKRKPGAKGGGCWRGCEGLGYTLPEPVSVGKLSTSVGKVAALITKL